MKLGLCLSGGGIKGAAHIGVIKAFEENNISIEYISGTSSGSIVASLYACGYSSLEMYDIFKNYSKNIKYFDMKNILTFCKDLLVHRDIRITGLNDGDSIYNIAKEITYEKGIKNISDVNIPLLIPAINIKSEELYVFYSKNIVGLSSGKIKYINDIELATAIRASCSFPGIFSPVKYKNELLVDGGIAENVPWSELKKVGADKVISVTFKDAEDKKCCKNLFEVLDKSLSVMSHELSKYEISGTDYLIEIKNKNIGLLDTKYIDVLYEEGYICAKRFLNKFKV